MYITAVQIFLLYNTYTYILKKKEKKERVVEKKKSNLYILFVCNRLKALKKRNCLASLPFLYFISMPNTDSLLPESIGKRVDPTYSKTLQNRLQELLHCQADW